MKFNLTMLVKEGEKVLIETQQSQSKNFFKNCFSAKHSNLEHLLWRAKAAMALLHTRPSVDTLLQFLNSKSLVENSPEHSKILQVKLATEKIVLKVGKILGEIARDADVLGEERSESVIKNLEGFKLELKAYNFEFGLEKEVSETERGENEIFSN